MTMRMRAVRYMALPCGALALVLGLAACAPGSATARTATAHTATAQTATVHNAQASTSTNSPQPPSASQPGPTTTAASAPEPVTVADGVIGRGKFSSADNAISGTVTITATRGVFDLSLSDFHSKESGELDLRLSPWPEGTPCLADEHSFDFGDLTPAPKQDGLRLGSWDLHYGDPSFYVTAVIDRSALVSGHPDPNGCVLTPVALAPITWNVPDTRPYLHPVDSGTAEGAHGIVTVANGRPATYLVAANDNLGSIADRFGITVDDIGYLNPLDSMPLQPGQTLNLSKSRRGAASVPPPTSP